MWSQCKHCLFKVQEREVLKYSCHVLFTVLITVVPSDWPNAEGGVKWPWCYSRPALVDACKGSSLSWPHGNLLFWGIRENYVAKSRWQGKKQSYRGLLPILPSLLQWDFLGFGLVFFFPSGSQNWNTPGGDWNQTAICAPLPSCFFLFFPCRRINPPSNLGITQFLPDLKPRHIAAAGLSASCQEEGCCKGKGTFLLNSSCSFEHNLCSRH